MVPTPLLSAPTLWVQISDSPSLGPVRMGWGDVHWGFPRCGQALFNITKKTQSFRGTARNRRLELSHFEINKEAMGQTAVVSFDFFSLVSEDGSVSYFTGKVNLQGLLGG